MNSIQIKKEFNAPLNDVFELLAKHETYNIIFAPVRLQRIKESGDPERPDGINSVRRVSLNKVKLLQEQITLLEPQQRIEYQIIHNSLVKHHLGRIDFEAIDADRTLVTYTIELQLRVPFMSKLMLAQLKSAIKLGFSKLAKTI